MRRIIILLFIVVAIGFQSRAQSVVVSKSFVKTAGASSGTPSALDTIVVSAAGFSNTPKLVCGAPFEISTDGTNFNDTLLLSASQTNVPVYIRTNATVSNEVFRSELIFLNGNFILWDRVYLVGSSLEASQYLSMCTWTIKWFGSPTDCGCDTALATENVISIVKELEVDVFAFQEIVSIPQLQKVAASLGSQYAILVSDYASQIPNTSTFGYTSAQKLAFIYNTQKLNQQAQFGLLRSTAQTVQGSTSPYYYFASGRWPYVLSVRHTVTNEVFNFFNIHAKAFAGSSDHNRRAGGALYMVDSMNTYWPNENNIILGDYNDFLEGAITAGFTISPYDYALKNGFNGITLPSKFPGETTFLGSTASVIDNYMFSDEAFLSYAPNSTLILREADLAINNFRNTTSDHLPVLSHISLSNPIGVKNIEVKMENVLVQPHGNELFLKLSDNFSGPSTVRIYSLLGQELFSTSLKQQSIFRKSFDALKSGVYIVQISNGSKVEIHKWLIP